MRHPGTRARVTVVGLILTGLVAPAVASAKGAPHAGHLEVGTLAGAAHAGSLAAGLGTVVLLALLIAGLISMLRSSVRSYRTAPGGLTAQSSAGVSPAFTVLQRPDARASFDPVSAPLSVDSPSVAPLG